jgi:phospholipid/cholesterol/gamma-HCH transport system substrate-binding protein
MKKSRDFVTGLVFFGMLLVLGIFTVILAGLRFGEVPKMTLAFADVDGLETGHDVRVDGFRCGTVRSMEIQPLKGRILVEIEFDVEPDIYVGAKFHIIAASPLGGRVVSILNPDAEERTTRLTLEGIGIHEGTAKSDVFAQASRILDENRENVKKAVANLAEFSDSLAARDEGGLNAMDKVNVTLDDIKEIVAGVKAGEGTVGRLLVDDTIAVRIESILEAADEGALGQLLRDETLKDDVTVTVKNLRTASDFLAQGDGTLAMLLKDPELYEKAVGALDNIEKATSGLSPDKGVLRVLADDETGLRIENTVASAESLARNLDELVKGVRRGEGTIGLLVADEKTRKRVEMAIARLDDFVEEQRENTTFLTFATLLLGAF